MRDSYVPRPLDELIRPNKVHDVAAALGVKARGLWAETPEGVLAPLPAHLDNDPEAPARLYEVLSNHLRG